MIFLGKGYVVLLRPISLCLFLIAFLLSTAVRSEEYSPLNIYLIKAEEKELYKDRYWEVLLHYKSGWTGMKSLIDDPRFYLSPDGKMNPKSELEATIRAFFESDKQGDEHPRCRFAARYEWLKKELNFDEAIFSEIKCAEMEKIVDLLHPKSVVFVFPASFMNNPASMFGHTLIRIDGEYESKLLSYAVNYAAYPDKMGILYPFKGIFGFYDGYFSLFPYYDMIKKYNDTEQRDMWEYKLNLTEEEVRRMILHIWELKDIYSYYYFFDENCSYNLLFLLEAARPSLYLTDNNWLMVIPVDTIRLVRDSGAVEDIKYRPAKATRVRYIASLLDEKDKKEVLKLVKQEIDAGSLTSDNNEEKIKMFDLAIEVIQYKYNKKELTKDNYLKLFLTTLKERSKLGIPPTNAYNIPFPVPPHAGHLSRKISLGAGVEGDEVFQEINYRPAYHSLQDPDEGYLEGSQIEFADTTVRYYDDGRWSLSGFDLLDIVSLSSRDRFFKPLSFKIKTGLIQKMDKEMKNHLVYQVNPGVGLSVKSSYLGISYGLMEADANLGNGFSDGYAVGIGVIAGNIKEITNYWKVNLIAEILFYELGERFQENNFSVTQIFKLNQNNSFNLSYEWQVAFNNDQSEMRLNWNYYF